MALENLVPTPEALAARPVPAGKKDSSMAVSSRSTVSLAQETNPCTSPC